MISPTRANAPDFLSAEWSPVRPNTDTTLMLGSRTRCLPRVCTTRRSSGATTSGSKAANTCSARTTARRRAPSGQPRSANSGRADPRSRGGSPNTLARHARVVAAARAPRRAAVLMAIALAAMLGQVGLPGGGSRSGTARSTASSAANRPPRARAADEGQPGRARIPVARVADMLLAPRQPFKFDGAPTTTPTCGSCTRRAATHSITTRT